MLAVGEKGGAIDLGGPRPGQHRRSPLSAAGAAVGGRRSTDARRSRPSKPPTATGWDRATASHNTVVVDGLNQRESLGKAAEPAAGWRSSSSRRPILTSPQVLVALMIPAYPQSTTRYRQTPMAAEGLHQSGYAISAVFEVMAGFQHRFRLHIADAASGSRARWQLSGGDGWGRPASLLPE